jgi:hypothetical protein
MTVVAEALVDTDALLNVLLFGFLLGAGVPAAFGLVLLGIDRRGAGGAATLGWTALALLGALACAGALALGVVEVSPAG